MGAAEADGAECGDDEATAVDGSGPSKGCTNHFPNRTKSLDIKFLKEKSLVSTSQNRR